MKRTIIACATALLVAASAGSALADSIKGTLGFTGKMGLINPADSEYNGLVIDTDPGVQLGGGMIYGFDNNAAFEMGISHSWFDFGGTDANLTDLEVGLQYRFNPDQKMVPYLGAGFDVLMPDIDGGSVDTTLGAHVKGGIDYFVQRNIAINGELKLTGGLEADIDGGGEFDPSSVALTAGVRFFFR